MISTIFFDLDATLYSYKNGHKVGLDTAFGYWSEITDDDFDIFYSKYMHSRGNIKRFLKGSVANHSRALYFQNMVEVEFGQPVPYHIAELTQLYWDSFIEAITPFDGVEETLQDLKNQSFTLAIITNMSAEIQVRKLHKLGLDQYIDALITSEEAGQQKPHPHIYLHAMNRFSPAIDPEATLMIGDNYDHDVEAAEFLGMTGILFTEDLDEVPDVDCRKAGSFADLMEHINDLNQEPLDGVIKYKLSHRETTVNFPEYLITDLIDLRDQLWQLNLIGVYPDDYYMTPGVGFGNASLRSKGVGDQFVVSGSQTGSKENTEETDYAVVLDFDIDANHLISKGPIKPSSESLSHAAIYAVAPEVNCVIHVHHKGMWDAFEEFDMLTTPDDVPYGTPEMAKALQQVYDKSPVLDRPIVMLGHIEGLITWGKTEEAAIQLYRDVLKKLNS